MTWVIGGATPFGQAFLIGDTRVTFGGGNEADLVRKVYWVGRDMAAGFAGSVRIGFELIGHLASRLSSDDPTRIWIPEAVAKKWSSEAADLFARHDERERAARCSILLATVSPYNNGPFARTVLISLKSPQFAPKVLGNFGSVQIGSGRDHAPYREWLESYFADPRFVTNFATWGAGIGSVLAHSLSKKITESPTVGVGPHLHVVACGRGERSEGNSSRRNPDSGEIAEMPEVATSYGQFIELAKRKGFAAAAARA